jgi:hypothetical protein
VARYQGKISRIYISAPTRVSPIPRSTSTSKLRASSMRSGFPPTVSYKSGLATCSSALSAGRPMMSDELYPRVGFIVTNMARSPENVVTFYNKRGTCEQWIKEGKGAIRWTRLA